MKTLLIAVAGAALLSIPAQAQIVPGGSQLNMITENFPGCADTTCSTLTTFGTTSSIANNSATLVTSQQLTAGGGEWDIFKITTNSGGSIAGDINSRWEIDMQYHLSKNANFDGVVSQWTTNGSPMSPINDFLGVGGANNPIPSTLSGITGPAYVGTGFKAPFSAGQFDYPGGEVWDEIFVDPFNAISEGGMDPSSANGYTFALHFDLQTPIPEASTWAMMLLGFMGLGFGAHRRSRKRDLSIAA